MHINSALKWIYFINGISSEGQRSASGARIETPHLLTVMSLCQGHCLFSLLSFLHLSSFAVIAACRALADESDYLIWLWLNEMCVCVLPAMWGPDFHAMSTLESLSDL